MRDSTIFTDTMICVGSVGLVGDVGGKEALHLMTDFEPGAGSTSTSQRHIYSFKKRLQIFTSILSIRNRRVRQVQRPNSE